MNMARRDEGPAARGIASPVRAAEPPSRLRFGGGAPPPSAHRGELTLFVGRRSAPGKPHDETRRNHHRMPHSIRFLDDLQSPLRRKVAGSR